MLRDLEQRFPRQGVLQSVEAFTFHHNVEWLLGPTVWGKASLGGLDMKPVAAPTLQRVLIYDMAFRTRMIELMNACADLDTALDAARADSDIRMMRFTTNVATDIDTPNAERAQPHVTQSPML